jgi:hypothetical protein
MNNISQILFLATFLWLAAGVIGFSWLYVGRIRRAFQRTKSAFKKLGGKLRSWGQVLVEACFLLGLFLIPIAIVLLNWFFNPV